MAEANDVALELEKLRGTCAEGFAQVKGQLGVLVERSDRTDETLRNHDARISGLERRVWSVAGGIATVGVVASYFVQNAGQ